VRINDLIRNRRDEFDKRGIGSSIQPEAGGLLAADGIDPAQPVGVGSEPGTNREMLCSRPDQLRGCGAAKRSPPAQVVNGFQDAGFTRPIVTNQNIDTGIGLNITGGNAPEVTDAKVVNSH